MRRLRSFISWLLWLLVCFYLLLIVMFQVPVVQNFMAQEVASILSHKLGTKVNIGSVNIGFLNHIILDDVHLYDQSHQHMLDATRMAAKVDILPLTQGRIIVTSAQLFGLRANIYKQTPKAAYNFQFVVDSLSSKDQTAHTPLNLRIQSLVIRNGEVNYNEWYHARQHTFDVHHIKVNKLSTHVVLDHLTDDAIALQLKNTSFMEQSGFVVEHLSFDFNADKHHAALSQLDLRLPQSRIQIPSLQASYRIEQGRLVSSSLNYSLNLQNLQLSPTDVACFYAPLKYASKTLSVQTQLKGNLTHVKVSRLQAQGQDDWLRLNARGNLDLTSSIPQGTWHVTQMAVDGDYVVNTLKKVLNKESLLPQSINKLGVVSFVGDLSNVQQRMTLKGKLSSTFGSIVVDGSYKQRKVVLSLRTDGFGSKRLLSNDNPVWVKGRMSVDGVLPAQWKDADFKVNAAISQLQFGDFAFQRIIADGRISGNHLQGHFAMNNPHGDIDFKGTVDNLLSLINKERKPLVVDADLSVKHLNLQRLKVTDALGDRTFSFNTHVQGSGSTLGDLCGLLRLEDFSMIGGGDHYALKSLVLKATNNILHRQIDVQTDFGRATIDGQFQYQTLVQSCKQVLSRYMPSLVPSSLTLANKDHFRVSANLQNSQLLSHLLRIPLSFLSPINIEGEIDHRSGMSDLAVQAPSVTISGQKVENLYANVTASDSLRAQVNGRYVINEDRAIDVTAHLQALSNQIETDMKVNVGGKHPMGGQLNALIDLQRIKGRINPRVHFNPSTIYVDTIQLQVQPSDISYNNHYLSIDHFELSNRNQHIIVNGQTSGSPSDSLTVSLHNIDVPYVLDLVNFHSVDFGGLASGTAYVKYIFTKPEVHADLTVSDFSFNDGPLGTLYADASFIDGQINIDAQAVADAESYTDIKGYISLKDQYICLPIYSHHTRLDFLKRYCGVFMRDFDVYGDGVCRVIGPLSDVNMDGDMTVNGNVKISSIGVTYHIPKGHVVMKPNEITFDNDTVYDRHGNVGVITGGFHHDAFRHMTFDININANNLLSYDFPTPQHGDTFWGTIYATGNCLIEGRSGETTMTINATPNRNSFMEYNAAYTGDVDENSFIKWVSADDLSNDTLVTIASPLNGSVSAGKTPAFHLPANLEDVDIPSDLILNFIINSTPDLTLKVLMDENTHDEIQLNGSGVIRASYFNKGAFQMYGNYHVDRGAYNLTIQNLIKKTIEFQPESSITFGGSPYDADLNLKGLYTVNGVSLSDLKLGTSFANNSIRVNCLMNILGTPLQPFVTFDLAFPTLSADGQQMIRSVINSDEEMSQQVLYLLAVGRFYPQGANNASFESNAAHNQTSLAMQSLLSGTLSQQINTVLSNVIQNNNWNFGANIATGDEGFSDAEYEGLLSGRLLNNRLMINGQFGYKDNAVTDNSSFIGNFDVRYLFRPNGNFAIRFYNQTNDRYFTRNSLTTQGVGLILKKDFTNIFDLFGRKQKKKKVKGKETH